MEEATHQTHMSAFHASDADDDGLHWHWVARMGHSDGLPGDQTPICPGGEENLVTVDLTQSASIVRSLLETSLPGLVLPSRVCVLVPVTKGPDGDLSESPVLPKPLRAMIQVVRC